MCQNIHLFSQVYLNLSTEEMASISMKKSAGKRLRLQVISGGQSFQFTVGLVLKKSHRNEKIPFAAADAARIPEGLPHSCFRPQHLQPTPAHLCTHTGSPITVPKISGFRALHFSVTSDQNSSWLAQLQPEGKG